VDRRQFNVATAATVGLVALTAPGEGRAASGKAILGKVFGALK